MQLSRRQFIKIGGGAAAGLAVGSGLVTNMWGLTPDAIADPGTDGDTVVPTFCEMCFWKCGVLAHVKDGRITKIVGNPNHPLSRGKLCPRGTGGAGLVYDPDRLRQPLMRREKRGEAVFEPVTWEEALDYTAENLKKIRDKHGPEALALFNHGFGASWFKTLMKAYGSANVVAPSYAQCRGAREVGFELTYGAPVGSPEVLDLANSRVITLLGAHLGENMHNTQVQDFAEAIGKGAQLIVVDPRFSTAAGKARYWLPIRPGTDLALLLAWMHVIVKERLFDRDYLERYAIGFEALEKHLEDKTPQWAFVHTGIEAETIVETARVIAGARPASLIHPGRRTAWYGDDTQRTRAIATLNALLGSWGRRGGFYLPTSASMPKVELPKPHHTPKAPADMPKGTVYPFANKVLAHGVRDASIPGSADYDVKGWLVYGTNLTSALPNTPKTIEAIQNLDFIAAIDVLPAEITGWADVVLPEATYLERYDDLHMPSFREAFVALRQPVVEPQHQSKPGWWIAKELGQRLGYQEYFPFDDVEEYLSKRLEAGGTSLAEIKKTGVLRSAPEPTTIEEGVEPTFATPSGKIELYSQQMLDAGLSPMPEFTAHEQPGPGQFRLLFGRAPVHTFGRSTNNRFLGEVMAENELWLNAQMATELGLQNGDHVKLTNQDGATAGPVRLKATQRIRQDCVYLVHGFGHSARGLTFAKGRGAADDQLMTKVKVDPVMGTTGMNVNFVRVERFEA